MVPITRWIGAICRRGSRCTKHCLYAHVVVMLGEVVAADLIPISRQMGVVRGPRESIAKLLGGPFTVGSSRDVEIRYPHVASHFMGQHQEHVQNLEANGGRGEKSSLDDTLDMLIFKCPPGWGGEFAAGPYIC